MAGHGFNLAGDDVAIEIMACAMADKDAAFIGKAPQEIAAFHANSITPERRGCSSKAP